MATQQPLQSEETDDYGIRPAGTSGSMAPGFLGGRNDADSGNLVHGTRLDATRGRLPEAEPVQQPQTQLSRVKIPKYQPPQAHKPSTFETVMSYAMPIVGAFAMCHAEGTGIAMADGTWKQVEDLDLMDETLLGGPVLGTGKVLCDRDLWQYMGVFVTGTHAVFEDGRWLRVAASERAEPVDLSDGPVIVFPVVTARHLLVTGTHIAADFAEIDEGGDMTPFQRLHAMNGDAERLDWLRGIDKALFDAQAAA